MFFDVSIGGEKVGKIVIGLFGGTVPRTVANFKALATHEVWTSYKAHNVQWSLANVSALI